jgi:hypothetical protein
LVWQQAFLVAVVLVAAASATTIVLVVVAVEQVLQNVWCFDEVSRVVVVHQEVRCKSGDGLLLLLESGQLLVGLLVAIASVDTVERAGKKRMEYSIFQEDIIYSSHKLGMKIQGCIFTFRFWNF